MKTLNDYDKQAMDFLTKTGVKMSITFLKHDKHFTDDKEKRDIYLIEISRGNRKMTFNFGNSINDSGIKIVNRNNNKVIRLFDPLERYNKNGVFNVIKFKMLSNWQFASRD